MQFSYFFQKQSNNNLIFKNYRKILFFQKKNFSENEKIFKISNQMKQKMKNNSKPKIDHYSIMISSKYFESIDDFIHLELCSPRFEGNMERFHFNPISLNYQTKQFFPSLETLHLYSKDDNEFKEDKKITQRIIWYDSIHSNYYNKYKNEGIVYKNVYYSLINKYDTEIIIPSYVNSIEGRYIQFISELKIPENIQFIKEGILKYSNQLTSLVVPYEWKLQNLKYSLNQQKFGVFKYHHQLNK